MLAASQHSEDTKMRCAVKIGTFLLVMTAAPALAEQVDPHADHQPAVQATVPGKPATNVSKPPRHSKHRHDCCPMMGKESADHGAATDKAMGADMMKDGTMNPSQDHAAPQNNHKHN
ncbi:MULTISPECIES: hypothetical protein [unclassified Sphingobium]|jgi:hypothetical protein|uniref:hypothetical protein n=1 Tax=unclassified Sphingobium TaxID=2611147 RepID=UPI0012901B89|nr:MULTISPECIES: hypothetical protein [unclassified Sphingobium]